MFVRFLAVVLVLAAGACGERTAAARAPAPRGDESARDRFRRPEALVAKLGVPPGARIADVGAGDGYLTWRLAGAAGPSGRVVATDVDGVALARLVVRAARGEAPAGARAPVEVRLVDAGAPGLEPGAYDLVVLAEVDHLLADRVAFLRALAAALAPGGRIAIENRAPHHNAALEAARRAGLDVVVEPEPVPGRFVMILEPRR